MVTVALLLFCAASDVPFAGTLDVDPSVADAEVFVDGLHCDTAPCEMDVSAGSHTITVRKAGYGTRTVTTRVAADGRTFEHVKLYPEVTDVTVRANAERNMKIVALSSLGASVLAAAGALIIHFAAFVPAYDAYARSSASAPAPGLDALRATGDQSLRASDLNRMNIATVGLGVAAGVAAATSLGLFLATVANKPAAASTEVKPMAFTPFIAPTQGGAHVGLGMTY